MNIIFDLYGTLVDIHTDENSEKVWQTFAKKMKKYKDYDPNDLKDEYFSLVKELEKDKEEINILDVFEKLFPDADSTETAITFRKITTDYIDTYDGVKKLLKMLKGAGHRIYLLSNAQAVFTNYELEKLGIKKMFDAIYLSSDHEIKKPNLDYFQNLLDTYGLDTASTVMIGNDYQNDILPAKKLGLKAIYVETNQSRKVDVEDKVVNFSFTILYEKINNLGI